MQNRKTEALKHELHEDSTMLLDTD